MAENRGVFRLRTLRTENVEGDGVPLDDVWLTPKAGNPFVVSRSRARVFN